MKTINITQDKFPILSKWEEKHLIDTLTNLVKKANPNLVKITDKELIFAAKMLEMDLQTQSGSIWSETENQEKINPYTHHNKIMMERMEVENSSWADN